MTLLQILPLVLQSNPTPQVEQFEEILDIISKVERSGRQVPPEWTTPDLVREVIGTDWISIEGLLLGTILMISCYMGPTVGSHRTFLHFWI